MKPERVRRPVQPVKATSAQRRARGGRAFAEGHAAEWIAALWLMLKGYQILGFRLKTPGAEIDILARKGRVLAVVEVKRRATPEAAQTALKPAQLERLRAAGQAVLRQRPGLRASILRVDTVTLVPGRMPRHRQGL
ncbi:YraN family protein [Brevundimonas sp. AJA228-03]|uniref:YraN family protein n=1 Tax=Brevundimonas sp. AJA228-03 TaxID=2752515 RepID=UPI001ADFB25C|nr:YraN family protein [Brevundimonas sp. AJA228-03]QTN20025.1 YraN family protein [Brevundimonas sp. AJA228-03]